MRIAGSISLLVMLALLSFSGAIAAQHEGHGSNPLSASLTGAAEVPGPGDPDGAGTAKIMLNEGDGKVCFELEVSNTGKATAAHIHEAPAGKAGPPVVTLAPPPESGPSKDCVAADKELIKKIMQNPENFYVNVHNEEFPNGAVRGQLSK
jgi:hypothetical protein